MIDIEIATGDPDDHRKKINEELNEASKKAGHPFKTEPLSLTAHIGGDEVGGLAGQFNFGWLYVMLLAVKEEARGRGVGSALMAEAEKLARARGALGVTLDTFEFQAPGFYARLGYSEMARLPGAVSAESRVYFVKRLTSG